MYMTEYIINQIGVTGAYKLLYCLYNDSITDNDKKTAYQVLNYYDLVYDEPLSSINANKVINTLLELEYDNSSVIDRILRMIELDEL